jgi:hypothetical protein
MSNFGFDCILVDMNIKKRMLWTFVIICSYTNIAHSQTKDLKALADSAVKAYTWEVQKFPKGEMMFLDVPYVHKGGKVEYLTLTVAKNKSAGRPAFISVIVPSNIDKGNGLFIAYAKDTIDAKKRRSMKMVKGITCRLDFEKCDTATCTARIIGGYVIDAETKNKLDEYQYFLTYDHVLFLVVYPDGSHKSIAVPLFSFKQQYKMLD